MKKVKKSCEIIAEMEVKYEKVLNSAAQIGCHKQVFEEIKKVSVDILLNNDIKILDWEKMAEIRDSLTNTMIKFLQKALRANNLAQLEFLAKLIGHIWLHLSHLIDVGKLKSMINDKPLLPLELISLCQDLGLLRFANYFGCHNQVDDEHFYTMEIDNLAVTSSQISSKVLNHLLECFYNDHSLVTMNIIYLPPVVFQKLHQGKSMCEKLLQYWIKLSLVDGKAVLFQSYSWDRKFDWYTLNYLIDQTSEISMNETLKIQDQYKTMTQSDMRKTEFKALVSHLCQSYPEEVINFVIQKAEQSFETLNWTFFLTFIGAMVRETGMDKLLNDGIVRKMAQILDGKEVEVEVKFIPFLMVARQASLETLSGSVFQNYSFWFSQTFGYATNIVMDSAKKITNLLKCFSAMVPYEPATTLRTHVARPMAVPLALRSHANDYYNLARTRLSDLNEKSPRASSSRLFTVVGQKVDTNEVDAEIEKALKQFKDDPNGCVIIPSFIQDMSIFRRVYFSGTFVPRLLALHSEEPSEIKALFIDALKIAGKLTN